MLVPEIVARMTSPPAHTTPSLAELGQHRFTALDGLGLDRPNRLARRLAELSASDRDDLRYFLVDIAKTTIDILSEQQQASPGPAIIWAGDADPTAMVGGTLLWADQYLISDRACATVEGPTGRECLLFSAVDDDEEIAAFYMWAPILSTDGDGHTTGRLFGPYRPDEDYGPWITQSRRETVTTLIHGVSRNVAIADAFGADWVTISPFKQRLLQRRGNELLGPQALIRADVPQLSAASAVALAKVAAEDEAVEALREMTRHALHAMRTLSPADQREGSAELGRELQARARELRREMASARRWKRDMPLGLSTASGAAAVASVAIGATGPAAGLISLCAGLAGLFGVGAAVGPYRADRAANRANPAFALLIGDGLVQPRSAPGEQPPAQIMPHDGLIC